MLRDLRDILLLRGTVSRAGFAFLVALSLTSSVLAMEIVRATWFGALDARISDFLADPDPADTDILLIQAELLRLYGAMLIGCVPFLLVFLAAAVARCRSLRISPKWVLLMGLPGINLVFTALLLTRPEAVRPVEPNHVISYR